MRVLNNGIVTRRVRSEDRRHIRKLSGVFFIQKFMCFVSPFPPITRLESGIVIRAF